MEPYRAYRVHATSDGVRTGIERMDPTHLPDHEVLVRVEYSSLNYKDALSARAQPGVTKAYPHTPGIDAAGIVVDSHDDRFRPGAKVIVTSYDLGMNTPGGFGERIRVPADWIVPLPEGWSTKDAMALGTGGLTAGLAVHALARWGVTPEGGAFVVSGASGGVGSAAVALLASLGAEVVAVTGTEDAHALLRRLGAARIEPREAFAEPTDRPLARGAYRGAIDVAGGATLANIVKQLEVGGAVASCGMVQSADVTMSVFPFILRGVALLGIDSEKASLAARAEVWEAFAGPWRLNLEEAVTDVPLDELDPWIDRILAGDTVGRVRVVVDPA